MASTKLLISASLIGALAIAGLLCSTEDEPAPGGKKKDSGEKKNCSEIEMAHNMDPRNLYIVTRELFMECRDCCLNQGWTKHQFVFGKKTDWCKCSWLILEPPTTTRAPKVPDPVLTMQAAEDTTKNSKEDGKTNGSDKTNGSGNAPLWARPRRMLRYVSGLGLLGRAYRAGVAKRGMRARKD